MRILSLKSGRAAGIEVRALLSEAEFSHLAGHLCDLYVFAAPLVNEPAAAIRTGARHSYAKYLLFPVVLRREHQATQFDFGSLRCGVVAHAEQLFVIYRVPRR